MRKLFIAVSPLKPDDWRCLYLPPEVFAAAHVAPQTGNGSCRERDTVPESAVRVNPLPMFGPMIIASLFQPHLDGQLDSKKAAQRSYISFGL